MSSALSQVPAVVLAGGFGTRLASVVSDRPKPMADIAGKPFLERLLDRLVAQGLSRVILAVGYKAEMIRAHFGSRYRTLALDYSEAVTPLGTGGAMSTAFREFSLESALVLNGDTYCTVDLAALVARHRQTQAQATLTLLSIDDTSRYGAVQIAADGRIKAFSEKSPVPAAGLINAGVYAVNRDVFAWAPGQAKYSFETDILQQALEQAHFGSYVTQASFIDIGVPDDYRRAQTLLADA